MADDRIEYAKLPPIDYLETETRQRVIALLESLDQVVTEMAKLADREDDLKQELERLQAASGRPGFRYGWLCFVAQSVAGRKTLDKMLLLENGVSAKTIESSYKEGKPGTRCTFKRLPETK